MAKKEKVTVEVETQEEEKETKEEMKKLKEHKKYGLVWEDHPENINYNAFPVLENIQERNIHTDNNKPVNLLIEGDNYHSLRSLLYTHKGKIDVIYIDPPYNTGNKDFVYNDQIIDKKDKWRHSKWLSFMSKRLELANELLSEDGIIFISIDDNEQAQLKLLCDEIFGEKSFVGTFPWKKRASKSDVPFNISQNYEWVVCYAKEKFKSGKEIERKYFTSPDFPNRPWRLNSLTSQRTKEESPNSYFTIVNPKTGTKYPPNPNSVWRISKDTFDYHYQQGKIYFSEDYPKELKLPQNSRPMFRVFLDEDLKKSNGEKPMTALSTVLPENEVGMTKDGTKQILEIFGKKVFPFPKPTSLIKYLINYHPRKDIVVLDFFAGSGTTGHAVLELNKEDGGNRKFILCTNNENNICEEITYKRLKRVIHGYTTPKGKEVEGLGGNLHYYKTKEVIDYKERV